MNVIKQQTVTYRRSELVSLLHKIDEVKNPYYLEVDLYLLYILFSQVWEQVFEKRRKNNFKPKVV